MCLMMRLWEFQNGKTGVYRQKINQDTVKNVKDQILKNNSFRKENHIYFTKTVIFQNLTFYIFTVESYAKKNETGLL